jgi:hypothetical protein
MTTVLPPPSLYTIRQQTTVYASVKGSAACWQETMEYPHNVPL